MGWVLYMGCVYVYMRACDYILWIHCNDRYTWCFFSVVSCFHDACLHSLPVPSSAAFWMSQVLFSCSIHRSKLWPFHKATSITSLKFSRAVMGQPTRPVVIEFGTETCRPVVWPWRNRYMTTHQDASGWTMSCKVCVLPSSWTGSIVAIDILKSYEKDTAIQECWTDVQEIQSQPHASSTQF